MSDATYQGGVHPVDEMLPAPKLFTLGFQHVLVMYAGAIAVPLIVGRALNLPPEEVAFLIEEFRISLFAQGVRTAVPVSPKRIRQAIAQARAAVA